ncbi:hypothetical protein V6x_10080 [Gimesia chilikensis]|uniref:Secreted protein n=1 Tax=Gimesia chilikensis TaxID=2605989 RepID=A0A517W7V5_9PLAN|nr:hypothetical protein V6x_10080 [Gimesia chilikensis]
MPVCMVVPMTMSCMRMAVRVTMSVAMRMPVAVGMPVSMSMTVPRRVGVLVRTLSAGVGMLNLYLEGLEQNSHHSQDTDDPGKVTQTLFHYSLTIILSSPKINHRSDSDESSSQNGSSWSIQVRFYLFR